MLIVTVEFRTGGGRITWLVTYQRANGNGFNRLESNGGVQGGVDGWMEEKEGEAVGETGLDKYRLRAFLQVKKDDTQAVLPIAKVRVVGITCENSFATKFTSN